MSKLNQIYTWYREHPDVDVIALKDGSFIGITEDLICHYPHLLFDELEKYTCMSRPDPKNRYNDSIDKYYEIDENSIKAHDFIDNADCIILKDGTELVIQETKVTQVLLHSTIAIKRVTDTHYQNIQRFLLSIQDQRSTITGEQYV